MRIDDLLAKSKVISKAPDEGYLLIYTRKQVYFEKYTSFNNVEDRFKGVDLLEIHLFDEKKEYRALTTESKRFEEGFVDHFTDFYSESVDEKKMNPYLYIEELELEKSKQKIDIIPIKERLKVLNKISYDENGMIIVDDYRFVMEEKNEQ